MREFIRNFKRVLACFLSVLLALSGYYGFDTFMARAEGNNMEIVVSPKLEGVYGTKVEDMTIVPGVVKSGGSEIIGVWTITDVNKSEVPSVGTEKEYELTFTPNCATATDSDVATATDSDSATATDSDCATATDSDFATATDSDSCSIITIKVRPTVYPKDLNAAGVSVTEVADSFIFDGLKKEPSVTVSDEMATITADDYDISYENNENAYTLKSTDEGFDETKAPVVKITGKGNYTGTVYRYFTIDKADASINISPDDERVTKVYGDADFSLMGISKVGEGTIAYNVLSGQDVIDVDQSGTIHIKKAGEAAINLSMEETGNYNGAASKIINVTVNKKSAANPDKIENSYIYSAGSKNQTITVDIAALLPNDRGETTYYLQECDAPYVIDEAVSVDGKLTYKIDDSGSLNDTTSLNVKIVSENYTDVTATINISLIDKNIIVQKDSFPVKIAGNTVLTYGDRIDKLKLNMQDAVFVIQGTDKAVTGTLSWTTPELIPSVGTVKADWVFTPDLPNEYSVCTGKVDITVVKANPIVKTPTAADMTYNPGISLEDISISGEIGSWNLGGVYTDVDGTWSWKDKDKVPVVNNSGYVAVFTPNDSDNYNKVEKTVSINVNKALPYITVLPGAMAITYGDELSKARISGGTVIYNKDSSVVAYNREVKGVFNWKDGSIRPAVSDSYKTKYTLVFTPFDSDNYKSCETEITLRINKKSAKELIGDTKEFVYTIGSDNEQVVNIAGMLPADCGRTAYRVSKSGVVSSAGVVDGKLIYKVIPGKKDSEGTVTVTVISDNYENHNYTVKVKLVDKEKVSLKDGCRVYIADETANLVYGEKLSKLSLVESDSTKVVFVSDSNGEVVEGKIRWENPDYAPSVDEKTARWVFTPNDTNRYMACSGVADINVVKATPDVGDVPVIEVTYNPSVTLKDIKFNVNGFYKVGDDVVNVEGEMVWKNPNQVPTADKQEYEAVFVPDNQINYNVSNCVARIKVKKATPKIVTLPVASDITYKELLGNSKISGGAVRYSDDLSVTGYDVEVKGTFAWANKLFSPSVYDSEVTRFDVVFTPEDTVNYETINAGITLKVNKIDNAPNMPYDSMHVKFAVNKKVGDVSLDAFDGWEWSEKDREINLTSDENGVVAVANYIDWDKGNYTNITKEVIIYMEQCHHRGGRATCTKHAICNICKQEYGELNPDNHENVELRNVVAATCISDGYTGDLCCADCGRILTQGESIRATGHDYMISLEIPATTTEEGLRTYTCTICGDSYSEDIPKLPTDDTPGTNDILARGLFVAEKTETFILAGMVVDTADMAEVEYSWWVSRDGGERWSLIQGWTKGNEWLSWNPKGHGDYMIMGKARLAGKTAVVEASLETTFHPAIKGICQMPYTGPDGGYLIGIESIDNVDNKYQYEMLILDCSLLAQGKDAWIYSTGRCGAEGNCLWTIWNPQYGYYWTLFRIYDNTGSLVDEICYGFVNAF